MPCISACSWGTTHIYLTLIGELQYEHVLAHEGRFVAPGLDHDGGLRPVSIIAQRKADQGCVKSLAHNGDVTFSCSFHRGQCYTSTLAHKGGCAICLSSHPQWGCLFQHFSQGAALCLHADPQGRMCGVPSLGHMGACLVSSLTNWGATSCIITHPYGAAHI